MKTLFNEISVEVGRKVVVIETGRIGYIKHVRGTCQDDLVTVEFSEFAEEKFDSRDLAYYVRPKPKLNKFKFKFWDTDDGGYFAFAITVGHFGRNKISFGLEVAGIRVVYFEYKRLLPSSNDKMDCYVGEINWK